MPNTKLAIARPEVSGGERSRPVGRDSDEEYEPLGGWTLLSAGRLEDGREDHACRRLMEVVESPLTKRANDM